MTAAAGALNDASVAAWVFDFLRDLALVLEVAEAAAGAPVRGGPGPQPWQDLSRRVADSYAEVAQAVVVDVLRMALQRG